MGIETIIAGIKLKNPFIIASGIAGFGDEYSKICKISDWGAFVTKTITLKPREGNPPPRVIETDSGMLNSIGLENPGIDKFCNEKIKYLKTLKTKIIVSIAGETEQEYVLLTEKINDYINVFSAVELNLSCPNVKTGLSFSTNHKRAFNVVNKVKRKSKLPVIAKLSPKVTDIGLIAESVENAGADAVAVINTFPGMVIDIETRRSCLANISGGLSGPAIKPIALHCVWEVYKRIKIPIIGIGGIASSKDAIQFFIAGATAIQIGSAIFFNPWILSELVSGLGNYLIKHKMRITDLIGSLKA